MKRFLVVIVTLVMLVGAPMVKADNLEIVTENYPPFNYQQDNGVITGFSTEVVREVLKEAGFEDEMKLMPWARAYKKALNEKNVLIYSIGRTEPREDLFKWVGAIADYKYHLFKLKDNENVTVNELQDAKEYKIGVMREDIGEQYLKGKGFNNLSPAVNLERTLKKLFGSRVDLICTSEATLIYQLKLLGRKTEEVKKVYSLDETKSQYYMACSKETPDEIVNKLKQALKKVKEDGRYEKIKNKWLK